LALLLLIPCASNQATAEDPPSPFEKAAAEAQQRTVKIYGAGIGRVEGYASGVLISASGDILAPQGVYLAGRRIRVVLPSGQEAEAQVIRRDRARQVALLHIEVKTPHYFELSDKPVGAAGDWVVTVSNAFKVADGDEPLGASLGVVSLRAKVQATQGIAAFDYREELLLIDAITSNPGAAGGAVVTIDGALAGLIGKPIESKTTRAKVSYAIPVDQLHRFVHQQESKAASAPDAKPGDLGLRIFTLSGRSAPAYIDRILPNGPAAKAGLRSDDLVVSLAGKTIRSVRDFQQAAANLPAGKTIEVIVKRKQKLVQVKLTPAAKE